MLRRGLEGYSVDNDLVVFKWGFVLMLFYTTKGFGGLLIPSIPPPLPPLGGCVADYLISTVSLRPSISDLVSGRWRSFLRIALSLKSWRGGGEKG